MKRLFWFGIVSGLFLGFSGSVAAADAGAGKAKAALCAGCHGPKGEGKTDAQMISPALAMQTEAYLVKSMQAYKTGVRQDKTMTPIFQAISEDDIRNLAAYYANLK